MSDWNFSKEWLVDAIERSTSEVCCCTQEIEDELMGEGWIRNRGGRRRDVQGACGQMCSGLTAIPDVNPNMVPSPANQSRNKHHSIVAWQRLKLHAFFILCNYLYMLQKRNNITHNSTTWDDSYEICYAKCTSFLRWRGGEGHATIDSSGSK